MNESEIDKAPMWPLECFLSQYLCSYLEDYLERALYVTVNFPPGYSIKNTKTSGLSSFWPTWYLMPTNQNMECIGSIKLFFYSETYIRVRNYFMSERLLEYTLDFVSEIL